LTNNYIANNITSNNNFIHYEIVGALIENGCFKDALNSIFEFIRFSNKYYDSEQPWITVKTDPNKCGVTLNTCIQIIANLSIFLEPFLPFTSAKIKNMLDIKYCLWKCIIIPACKKSETLRYCLSAYSSGILRN